MNKYQVEFEATAPMWDGVIVEANSKDEAESLAHEQIEHSFPEASDITVIDIKEISR